MTNLISTCLSCFMGDPLWHLICLLTQRPPNFCNMSPILKPSNRPSRNMETRFFHSQKQVLAQDLPQKQQCCMRFIHTHKPICPHNNCWPRIFLKPDSNQGLEGGRAPRPTPHQMESPLYNPFNHILYHQCTEIDSRIHLSRKIPKSEAPEIEEQRSQTL